MGPSHPLVPWIVEHPDQLRNKFLLRGRAGHWPKFELQRWCYFCRWALLVGRDSQNQPWAGRCAKKKEERRVCQMARTTTTHQKKQGTHPSAIDPPIFPTRMRLNRYLFCEIMCHTGSPWIWCCSDRHRDHEHHAKRYRDSIERLMERELAGAARAVRERERPKHAKQEEQARRTRATDEDMPNTEVAVEADSLGNHDAVDGG